MVLAGLEGFREDYINHIKKGKCSVNVHHSIPCVALCPAQVDIPGYIALVGAGRYADAVKLIRKDNPLPYCLWSYLASPRSTLPPQHD